jgi:hypothetical protein
MAQVAKTLEDGQSNLLEDVVRMGWANHRRNKGTQWPVVAAKQYLQRVFVAVLGQGDEERFAGILVVGHPFI